SWPSALKPCPWNKQLPLRDLKHTLPGPVSGRVFFYRLGFVPMTAWVGNGPVWLMINLLDLSHAACYSRFVAAKIILGRFT
ncbi:MAG: hypothetical protein MI799_24355, partial [Desulfobacterales bacterium]|nr:hypothetical protein [Desulfobacterales bacterium]